MMSLRSSRCAAPLPSDRISAMRGWRWQTFSRRWQTAQVPTRPSGCTSGTRPAIRACSKPRLRLVENRTAEAESLLRSQLDRHPTDIAAVCMLADVFDRVADRYDRKSEAEALLMRCLELAPSYTRARHNYAVVLLRQNKAPAALRATDRLLAEEPKNPDFCKLRAAILVRLREIRGVDQNLRRPA